MDKMSPSHNSNNISNGDNNIRSKLRRLRIQEALLLQSIQKPAKHLNEDVKICDTHMNSTSSYKELLKKVKESYINLKNLYDEVKTNTQSQELLADLDIEEMKKKIFELETDIKIFKSDISSDLAALKATEQDLNKQINENPNEIEKIKRRPKTHAVNYNTIVPSPVRVLMTSPFKCSEVQQFQEFMHNSPNRYGGWNEYSHNIFVKYWQKFFGKTYSSELEDGTVQRSESYDMFIEDVMPKLQGVTANDINSHVKWYVKYLFLKEKQQNAIDKWKMKKISTRKVLKKVKYADEEDRSQLETMMDDPTFIACNFNTFNDEPAYQNNKTIEPKSSTAEANLNNLQQKRTHSILKPTKQWLNRNQKNNDVVSSSGFYCIETTEKLRTPCWRLGLD